MVGNLDTILTQLRNKLLIYEICKTSAELNPDSLRNSEIIEKRKIEFIQSLQKLIENMEIGDSLIIKPSRNTKYTILTKGEEKVVFYDMYAGVICNLSLFLTYSDFDGILEKWLNLVGTNTSLLIERDNQTTEQ